MALSIGVKAGSTLKIGTAVLCVKQIVTPTVMVVSVNGGPDITVTETEKVNILPEVFVSAGKGGKAAGNRLAFEAPRYIGIHRI